MWNWTVPVVMSQQLLLRMPKLGHDDLTGRGMQPLDYYGEWVSIADVELEEPATVKKALTSPDKSKWKIAMEKEFESLRENNVWELVELPQDRTAVGSKWVFKAKVGAW